MAVMVKKPVKKVWTKCGVLLIKDNGKQSIKIDTIPVGFDGWLVVGDDDKVEGDKAF